MTDPKVTLYNLAVEATVQARHEADKVEVVYVMNKAAADLYAKLHGEDYIETKRWRKLEKDALQSMANRLIEYQEAQDAVVSLGIGNGRCC